MHLTVLIENMRREGFELMVGPPTVIDRMIDGVKCEPFEQVDVTVPNDYSSAVVDMLNKRKGEMLSMGPAEGELLEQHTNLTFYHRLMQSNYRRQQVLTVRPSLCTSCPPVA